MESSRQITLSRGHAVSLDLASLHRIEVVQGKAWITLPGEYQDHFVAHGHTLRVSRVAGTAVVESAGKGSVTVRAVSAAGVHQRILRVLSVLLDAARCRLQTVAQRLRWS